MAEEVSGVELRDIASGKLARTLPFPAANGYNILTRGGELPLNSASRRPSRALVVPTGGTLSYLGLDGVRVDLADPGGAFQWNVQAIEIVDGLAENVVVIY